MELLLFSQRGVRSNVDLEGVLLLYEERSDLPESGSFLDNRIRFDVGESHGTASLDLETERAALVQVFHCQLAPAATHLSWPFVVSVFLDDNHKLEDELASVLVTLIVLQNGSEEDVAQVTTLLVVVLDVPDVLIARIEVARSLDHVSNQLCSSVRLVNKGNTDGSHLDLVQSLNVRNGNTSGFDHLDLGSTFSLNGSSERLVAGIGDLLRLHVHVSHLIQVLPQHGARVDLGSEDRGRQMTILSPLFGDEGRHEVRRHVLIGLRKVDQAELPSRLDLGVSSDVVGLLDDLVTNSEEVDKLIDVDLTVAILVHLNHELRHLLVGDLSAHVSQSLVHLSDVQLTGVVCVRL